MVFGLKYFCINSKNSGIFEKIILLTFKDKTYVICLYNYKYLNELLIIYIIYIV
jgi:hypothetical protein